MISVIVPTYNRPKQLQRCLAALLEQHTPLQPCEVIVADDGSTDSSEETTVNRATQQLPIRYVRQTHRGIAATRNLGIRTAQGRILAFIDDDCIVDSDWLRSIEAAYRRHPDIAVLQGRIAREETGWIDRAYAQLVQLHTAPADQSSQAPLPLTRVLGGNAYPLNSEYPKL